jgi:tRNA wybutosine-synthesizing protein 3
MEYFDRSKNSYLKNLNSHDKSRKGGIDNEMLPVMEILNKHQDYYTTSSCSGRINLFVEADSQKKHECKWLLVKHGKIKYEEIRPFLTNLPQETVWFRQEPVIIHIACRNNETANKLLTIVRDLSFKRSGIIAERRRTMIEVVDTQRIDTPIATDKKLLIDERFVKFLIKKANSKLEETKKKLKKLEKKLKKFI